MIAPEEFPYIKSLYVNDCYAYKDFNIELHDYKPFSHLILTGKNGSGKSTILRAVSKNIDKRRSKDNDLIEYVFQGNVNSAPALTSNEIRMVELKFVDYEKSISSLFDNYNVWREQSNVSIHSFFKVYRHSKADIVESPTKESDFIEQLNKSDSSDFFSRKFLQYLVNKKVNQAFDQIDNDLEKIKQTNLFFDSLLKIFQGVFNDNNLILNFERNVYQFFIKLSDGRNLTFDILPEGFSALITILMDLLIRVDLIRKQVNDYTYNPCGIVLIDEPEAHLHLQLQEQVLPLLTSLFPNIQFIAATHSPAVIASIKNATIFDLTTKETRISEEAVGRSYSDLMRAHFGMNNEYSGIADDLFKKVDDIIKENKNKPEVLKASLQEFFIENEAYFSPSFRVELESMILENA